MLVRDSIHSVVDSIIIGLLLSIGVLVAFLKSWRTTVVAALVIPIATLMAIVFMKLFHMSFNLMTLGGLHRFLRAAGPELDRVDRVAGRLHADESAGDLQVFRPELLPDDFDGLQGQQFCPFDARTCGSAQTHLELAEKRRNSSDQCNESMDMLGLLLETPMPTLYVENVPKNLYDALRAQARQNRKSIAAEVLSLLEENIPTALELRSREDFLRRIQRFRAKKPQSTGTFTSSEEAQRADRWR